MFLHYRPKDWTFNSVDIRVAIPPHWGDGLGRRSVAVDADGDVEDSSVVVEFALGRGAPAGVSVAHGLGRARRVVAGGDVR